MRGWYLLVAAVVVIGFVLQFYLLFTGGADANSGEAGASVPIGIRFARLFSFFTVDSNLLVLVVAIGALVGRDQNSMLWRVIRLAALLSITVTGTVFGVILSPGIVLRDEAVIVNTLFHIVSPVLFLLGWLLWGPRRQWSPRIALLAFIWPVAWLAFTFVRGATTGWYPYPFLNVGQIGLGPALFGAGVVIVYAMALCAIVLLVDRFVPAFGRSYSKS